jgi:hypothetical protein
MALNSHQQRGVLLAGLLFLSATLCLQACGARGHELGGAQAVALGAGVVTAALGGGAAVVACGTALVKARGVVCLLVEALVATLFCAELLVSGALLLAVAPSARTDAASLSVHAAGVMHVFAAAAYAVLVASVLCGV